MTTVGIICFDNIIEYNARRRNSWSSSFNFAIVEFVKLSQNYSKKDKNVKIYIMPNQYKDRLESNFK